MSILARAKFPPLRNARIYWRPDRGEEDRGGFYPVCLEPECGGMGFGDQNPPMATGEAAFTFLLKHRKSDHGGRETTPSVLDLPGDVPRYVTNPVDTDPGAP